MRLLSLQINSFSCVEAASVDFGAGLNVLYGPNDMGKSSLLEALRAVLLLPDSAAIQRDFIPWGKDVSPRVSVIYSTGPTSFWRVKKAYSTPRGSSTLETSKDGTYFTPTEHRDRRVDEEVRGHLVWGLPAVGKSRNLPDSFLASVLLSKQGEVDELLRRSLADDPDDCEGKARIGKALQAAAQDPKFRAFLTQADERVGEVFNFSQKQEPKWKTAKSSPVMKLRARLEELQKELDDVTKEVDQTDAVLKELEAATKALDEKEAQRQLRVLELGELERLLTAWNARRLKEEVRKKAADELARMDKALADVAALRAECKTREGQVQAAATQLETAKRAEEAARAALDEAKGDLTKRQAGVATLEKAKAELGQKQHELESASLKADTRRASARAAGDLEAKVAQANQKANTLRAQLEIADKDVATFTANERELEEHSREGIGLEHLVSLDAANADLAKANQDAENVARLATEATTKRAESKELEAEVTAAKLPAPGNIEQLRELERQRIKADAVLEVGLSVEVRPERPLDIRVSLDGVDGEPSQVSTSVAYAATRELELAIASVGRIVVRGGKKEERAEAEKVRKRWDDATAPLFAASGVKDLNALAQLCADAAKKQARAKELAKEAKHADDLARQSGDVSARRADATIRVAKAEEALVEFDRGALEATSATLGALLGAELAKRKRGLPAQLQRAREASTARKVEREGLAATLVEHERQTAVLSAQLDSATKDLGQPWKIVHDEMVALVEKLDAERRSIVERLEKLSAEVTKTLSDAADAVNTASSALESAKNAYSQANEAANKAASALAGAQGRLAGDESRAPTAECRAAAKTALDVAADDLQATQPPPKIVGEADVDRGRKLLEQAIAELNQASGDVQKVTGKLQQLGRADAKDHQKIISAQVDEAKKTLERAEESYFAWLLLRDTLVEVESEQETQLGELFATPLQTLFKGITGGRYDGVTLDPQLKTEGVLVSGAPRDPGRLSVGTREQLATVFRVALAKELRSTLVLDDQLVQSDAERMTWFSKLLRDVSQGIQVIVLTCRPADYLEPAELPAKAETFRDSAGVRAIDLAKVITRAGSTPPPVVA